MHKSVSRLIIFITILAAALVSVEHVPADEAPGTEYPASPINLIIETSAAPSGSWWCGPAAMQAAIRWNTGTRYEQRTIWDTMKDHTCGEYGGRDYALPGEVGDEGNKLRRMNISKDFGVDPHAVAWGMEYYNPGLSYNYWRYDSLYEATRYLLWTVEVYNQPVLTAVGAGNHYVDVVAHKSDRSARDGNGPGTIYRVYYFDSMYPERRQSKDYQWGQWNWDDYFRAYSDTNDPDPTTGWYITPPDHWWNHWVTVERAEYVTGNPDWGYTNINGTVSAVPHQPLTYLPKVRGNYNGWNSTIVLRNNAGVTTNASITFYDAVGTPVGTMTSTAIGVSAALRVNVADWVSSFSGSAIVAASGDVSVVLEDQHTDGRTYAYNGMAATDALNPDWGQAGTNIYLPGLMNNNYGWSTSVTIFNTASSPANFSLTYFGQNSGGPWPGPQGTLAPYAFATYLQDDPSGCPVFCPTVGAGRITSDQPLAVIVTEKSSGVTTSFNGTRAGATTINLPAIMANNYGWLTGIATQNLGDTATDITVTYYPSPGYPARNSETVSNVQPNATAIFVQSGGQWSTVAWVGSARVTAAQPIAAIVNQVTPGKGSTYNGFANGTRLVILPDIRNNHNGWTSGVQVQNLDSAIANIVVRVNGAQTWSGSIGAYQSITLYPVPGTGGGFQGTATIESTNGRRLAAIVNNVAPGQGDRTMTYDGVNR